MSSVFPEGTSTVKVMTKLIRCDENLRAGDRMSARMTRSAVKLEDEGFIGWQMIVPRGGAPRLAAFGSEGVTEDDLEWFTENNAITGGGCGRYADLAPLSKLYELVLPLGEEKPGMGFCSETGNKKSAAKRLPRSYTCDFGELVRALKTTGGAFRAVLGKPTSEEAGEAERRTLKLWSDAPQAAAEYIGIPVRARFLLRLPAKPGIRLLTVIEQAAHGAELIELGDMSEKSVEWDRPLKNALALPDHAARIMLLEPIAFRRMEGIETVLPPAPLLEAQHPLRREDGAIRLGSAVNAAGVRKQVTLPPFDMRRHVRVMGQTGTGKSTLLCGMIVDAIKQGYGLTFFDPHGATVDTVLKCIPPEHMKRVRVVRIGDAENPVPINIWESGDPDAEEKNISDLCELFADIFDPKREGIVGPRYERWLSTFSKAAIALLGKKASLLSVAVISQSKDNMRKVCSAIRARYPELAETISQEYGQDNSREFQNELNWFLCKFQRLTAVEQLRATIGGCANALKFDKTIDTDTVTLIDLASPQIGTGPARIVGTMIMLKLWTAALSRRRRDMNHLVFVDEASLFQTQPMPRMLAESRKFGLAITLCHQHNGQMTREVLEALEANSASTIAFRLSPRDAAVTAGCFPDDSAASLLPRLDAFNAIATLSVNGRQTAPFTLSVSRPPIRKDGERIAAEIERESRKKLVEPYRKARALSPAEINEFLTEAAQDPVRIPETPANDPEWLTKWNNFYNDLKEEAV